MNNPQAENEKIINDDFDRFYNSVYAGHIKVPEDTMTLFRSGILELAPYFHKVNFNKVKHLVSMEADKLTIGDLNDVIKVIVNTPFKHLYDKNNITKAVDSYIKFEKFILSYNEYVEDFRKKLEVKNSTLTALTRNVNPQANGLKIIN